VEFFVAAGIIWAITAIYRRARRVDPRPPHTHSREIGLADGPMTLRGSSPSYATPPASSLPPLAEEAHWVPSDQETDIAGFSIPRGLLYVGKDLSSVSGWVVEPSLINPKLYVNVSQVDQGGWDMGPWPSYTEMSPASRAAYLQWQASGRRDPNAYIGYVFLYFFGLERRLLAPAESSPDPVGEAKRIHGEVKELLKIYGGYANFRECALRFLEALEAVLGLTDKSIGYLSLSAYGNDFPLQLKMELGRQARSGEPVRAAQALAWVICDPARQLRTPAQHCRPQFVRLFHKFYTKAFGEGLRIKPNGTKLRAFYQPMSPSFANSVELPIPDLPDVTVRKDVGDLFWDIAERCTDELEPYSLWLGSSESAANLPAALAWSPSALANDHRSLETYSLANALNESAGDTDYMAIDAEALLERCALSNPQAPTRPEASTLVHLLAKLGYGLEPDLRFGERQLDPSGKAVLFRLPVGATTAPTRNYTIAHTALRIAAGASFVGAGLSMSDAERLMSHLKTALSLTFAEGVRLQAYLLWLLKDPVDPQALGKRLQQLDAKQQAIVARFLVALLAPGRDAAPDSVRLLSKVSRTLGLDLKRASESLRLPAPQRGLMTLERKDLKDEAKVVLATGDKTGPPLIPRPVSGKDLAEVTAILSGVFTRNHQTIVPLPSRGMMNKAALKLDDNDVAFIRKLSQKATWSRRELERISTMAHIFLDGIIDKLNDLALQNGDEPLLEGEDPIQINESVMKVMLQ